MKFLVVNGPNLNFLGIREKGVYGSETYKDLVEYIKDVSGKLTENIEIKQSNSEGEIIDFLQKAYYDKVDGIIINPGAYTHYSYAIRDALASIESIPKIEVHISNVHTREEFRHVSVTAPVCTGQVVGLGLNGYLYAMQALCDMQ